MGVKRLIVFAVLLLFGYLTTRPLFTSGFFPMHDDAQVARVVVMGKALRNGQFPVRLAGDLGYGYGYPLFNFYGPLPYYLGGVLYDLGLSGLVAAKIMIFAGVFICGVSMYLLSSSFFGMYGGLLSAALYMFLPYRAVQLYVRGAVGELWASACIPFVVYGISMIWKKRPERGVAVGGLGLMGVILSHTVFGYVTGGTLGFLLIICFLFLWMKRMRPFFLGLIFMTLVGLGLSAFFWLPAFAEIGFTNVFSAVGASADYHNHFVCMYQLWDSPWGFGGSAPGCLDGLSFKIGKAHVLLFFLVLILLFFFRKKEKTNLWVIGICLIGVVASILAMTSISIPLWEIVPYSSFIQYPWRLLATTGFFIAWAGGYLLYRLPGKFAFVGFLFACALIIGINVKVFEPQYLYDKPLSAYESPQELRYRASRVSDEYLPPGIPKPENEQEIIAGRLSNSDRVRVTVVRETETEGIYTIETDQDGENRLSMAYFPGWHFFVNGNEVQPHIVDGMPSVILSKGVSELTMRFINTPIRNIANSISLLTCLVIILIYVKKTYRHYRHTRL